MNIKCNIGPTLAKNIHCSTNDFMQYCFTTVKESMYCNPPDVWYSWNSIRLVSRLFN